MLHVLCVSPLSSSSLLFCFELPQVTSLQELLTLEERTSPLCLLAKALVKASVRRFECVPIGIRLSHGGNFRGAFQGSKNVFHSLLLGWRHLRRGGGGIGRRHLCHLRGGEDGRRRRPWGRSRPRKKVSDGCAGRQIFVGKKSRPEPLLVLSLKVHGVPHQLPGDVDVPEHLRQNSDATAGQPAEEPRLVRPRERWDSTTTAAGCAKGGRSPRTSYPFHFFPSGPGGDRLRFGTGLVRYAPFRGRYLSYGKRFYHGPALCGGEWNTPARGIDRGAPSASAPVPSGAAKSGTDTTCDFTNSRPQSVFEEIFCAAK
mmetsp:Transcript_15094/g.30141  ORF Transcript_15094/g.30141 Transcript_15094/m.30141 type:complete len:314 (-) Transcript_15094:241-1182(-)